METPFGDYGAFAVRKPLDEASQGYYVLDAMFQWVMPPDYGVQGKSFPLVGLTRPFLGLALRAQSLRSLRPIPLSCGLVGAAPRPPEASPLTTWLSPILPPTDAGHSGGLSPG